MTMPHPQASMLKVNAIGSAYLRDQIAIFSFRIEEGESLLNLLITSQSISTYTFSSNIVYITDLHREP